VNVSNDPEEELMEFIQGFQLDPLGYVLAAFEWGKGELAKFDGPDEWQREILQHIGDALKDGKITVEEAIQLAVASGHGIGKSALVAWIILWAISTYVDTKGVVTANTETQLKTKTWAELSKWHRLCINSHWFTLTATALFSKDPLHEKEWRIDQVAWSEKNTEAFAGLHNLGKRVLLLFDEASAIPDLIWEVSEGALTDSDTEIIWCCFGNPTRNVGRFRECFDGGKFAHRWKHRQIDSRGVKITNKAQIQKTIEDYGEDHDVVRVRVKGVFPSASFNALFGPDEIDAAMAMEYKPGIFDFAPVILGGDVARQGDDDSAVARRQGKVIFPLRTMHIPDTSLVAAQFNMELDEHKADAFFIDASGGYGVGVIDAMRQTNHDCIEVYFGGKATDQRYFDKRSEMYFELAKWIRSGGALPNDPILKEELLAHTYIFTKDKFRLCSKDDVKEVIGRSPDKADSVALTFAFPVVKRSPLAPFMQQPVKDYDPYANTKY
jgi:hypothetical protein